MVEIRIWLAALMTAGMLVGCQFGVTPDTDETPDAVEAEATAPAGVSTAAATAVADSPDVTPEPGDLDLMATVRGEEDLSMLGAALLEAGLGAELEGGMPLTLLAPTDSAFAALPQAALDTLLADPDLLGDVLQYHLIAGTAAADELADLGAAMTIQGEPVTARRAEDDTLLVNDARVVETDISAANGVLHKLDAMLIPPAVQAVLAPALEATTDPTMATVPTATAAPADVVQQATPAPGTPVAGATPLISAVPLTATPLAGATPEIGAEITTTGTVTTTAGAATPITGTIAIPGTEDLVVTTTDAQDQTIVDVLAGRPDLSSISAAVAAGGLAQALVLPGPFTFFAPTDEAFARMPAEEAEALLNSPTRLARTLRYHTIADRASPEDLARLGSALSTLGQPIDLTISPEGQLLANGAPVLESVAAANGFVLVLDGILIPAAE